VQLADEVLKEGCITGDRINGLCDGLTGDWYCKFDTFHPAADRGIPVTRVISRMTLQRILAETCQRVSGKDVIVNGVKVTQYANTANGVTVTLDNGDQVYGDVLVGSDGIYSRVRKQMIGETPCHFSGYTCYTGISDFCPPDIDTVGYRVFLGNGRYFVSSDVGGGKMQWYAFHAEAAGGTDEEGRRKERLIRLFGDWCDTVTDLIRATPEADVLRRDIYDRAPIFRWVDGRVALLGDAAHAMQPNLGQGGCMAIEDAFVLLEELEGVFGSGEEARAAPAAGGVTGALFRYQLKRLGRAAAIHGMARMAAFMASTYKTYLGEGMGPLEPLTRLRIPHPGRVAGRFAMLATMPVVLDWVLGGFSEGITRARTAQCRLGDSPTAIPCDKPGFRKLLDDDGELLATANCDWVLVPGSENPHGDETDWHPIAGLPVGTTGAYKQISDLYRGPVPVYRSGAALTYAAPEEGAVPCARIEYDTDTHLFDLVGERGVTVVRSHTAGVVKVGAGGRLMLHPGDEIAAGEESSEDDVLVMKTRHVTLRSKGDFQGLVEKAQRGFMGEATGAGASRRSGLAGVSTFAFSDEDGARR